ncbi:hypothetical protein [Streptomyces violaceusniger]
MGARGAGQVPPDVFCALDVGKSAHHGTALLADGRTTFDKPPPSGEP